MSKDKRLSPFHISSDNSNMMNANTSVILDVERCMHEILSSYSCERYYHFARDPTFALDVNKKYRELLYGDGTGSLCVAWMEYEILRARNQERSFEGLRDELNVLKQKLETVFKQIRKEQHNEKNSKRLGNRRIPVLGKGQNTSGK